MKGEEVSATLSSLGLQPSAETLRWFGIVTPMLAVAAIFLYKYWKKRVKQTAKIPSPPVFRGPTDGSVDIVPRLRDAWLRFSRRLPAAYRRSILGFDHFVVLGLEGSGKTELALRHTDTEHETKMVLGNVPPDPDMHVALGSHEVILEVPTEYVEDDSRAVEESLTRLFRPLYQRKTPTVIVVVDAAWLKGAGVDRLGELARAVRAKVGLLAKLRGAAVELRVVLTHLDLFDGFEQLAAFFGRVGMSMRIPLGDHRPVKEHLDEWLLESEHQLPRALTLLNAADYRKVLGIASALGTLREPLGQLLEGLYSVDAAKHTPLRGGVYLSCTVPDVANPFHVTNNERPPSPLRVHLVRAVAIAVVAAAFLVETYREQEATWVDAEVAVENYGLVPQPSHEQLQGEHDAREKLAAFTQRRSEMLPRFPDYFARHRVKARKHVHNWLLSNVLRPQLRKVAKDGIPNNGSTLRWRRVIYILAIIHSSRNDELELLSNRELVSQMSGLREDIIRDYLSNTDIGQNEPENFELEYEEGGDLRDQPKHWSELPKGVTVALSEEWLSPDTVRTLQTKAKELYPELSRFENDQFTLELFGSLDRARDSSAGGACRRNPMAAASPGATTGTAEGVAGVITRTDGQRPVTTATRTNDLGRFANCRLYDAYYPIIGPAADAAMSSEVKNNIGEFRRLIELVLGASIEDRPTSSLEELIDALGTVANESGKSFDPDTITIDLEKPPYAVSASKWIAATKAGRVAQLIEQFAPPVGAAEQMFFASSDISRLRNVVWNADGRDALLFRGASRMRGQYTAVAFRERVRDPVGQMETVLAKVPGSQTRVDELRGLVRDAICDYASNYAKEADGFLREFDVGASSSESLNVLLSQIVAATSPFDDFVRLLDDNTSLSLEPAAASKTDGAEVGAVSPSEQSERAMALLEPINEALSAYRSWHAIVGDGGSASELGKYKAIIAQLLGELATYQEQGGDSDPSKVTGLQDGLSPIAQLTLTTLLNAEGSYFALVNDWVESMGLERPDQKAPFVKPVEAALRIGGRELERRITEAWEDVREPLHTVVAKFPFDQTATTTASPAEVSELFAPSGGLLSAFVRDYLDPISVQDDGGELRLVSGASRFVHLLPEMYRAANAARTLSRVLWDKEGLVRPIVLRLTPEPLSRGSASTLTPVRATLEVGPAKVISINQIPETTDIQVDWTRDQLATLGIDYLSDTSDTLLHYSLSGKGKYWRYLRLLSRATKNPSKDATKARIYSWEMPSATPNGDLKVEMRLQWDPFSAFVCPLEHDDEGGVP